MIEVVYLFLSVVVLFICYILFFEVGLKRFQRKRYIDYSKLDSRAERYAERFKRGGVRIIRLKSRD